MLMIKTQVLTRSWVNPEGSQTRQIIIMIIEIIIMDP